MIADIIFGIVIACLVIWVFCLTVVLCDFIKFFKSLTK